MALPWYQYTPLTSETLFRLFRLTRSQSTSDVSRTAFEIELFEASLENPPPFEAVSYAWGSGGLDCTILCNGQRLRVSQTVEDFFHGLRSTDSVRTLWIDAICIDQASVTEKNVQVPKMRTIYSEAETVWVWLGRASPETDIVFDHLSEVKSAIDSFLIFPHDTSVDFNVICEILLEPRRRYKDKVVESRGIYDAIDTDFITDVLNLPWFSRTWTVQELFLARNALILCGTKCLPWISFRNSLGWLQEYENSSPAAHAPGNMSNPAAFSRYFACYNDPAKFPCNSQGVPISAALALVRSKKATDPKDKVYGVYGLLGDESLPEVNYNCTTRDVYIDITAADIKCSHSLRVLREACLRQLLPDLPSWVPDWSNTSFFQPHTGSGISDRSPVYKFDEHRLSLAGIFVDTVSDIAQSTSMSTADYRQGWNARNGLSNPMERHAAVIELVQTLQAWIKVGMTNGDGQITRLSSSVFYNTVLQDMRYHDALSSAPTQDMLQTWIHILTADPNELQLLHHDVQTRAGYEPIVRDYVRLFGCSQSPEEWPEELMRRLVLRVYSARISRLQHDISVNTYQRTLFRTQNGYMGVGPRWIQPNDLIVVFAGETVPFVVRKAEEHYSLIGPAYVRGMMREEKWDDAKVQMITLV